MIIKNNYNSKNTNPLDDYTSIGKGSHSLDNELKREKEGFIRENMKNPILQKFRDNKDETIDPSDDNWKIFR